MTNAQRRRLSKLMSYLLRHRPDEAGLTLDERGMVPLEALLAAIRRRKGYEWVTEDHVREVVATSNPPRFRLEGGRIGARYGHSRRVRVIAPGDSVEPPEVLYHGTSRRAVSPILAAGLQPQERQFVHLSATPEAALRVGLRRDPQPAVLAVYARRAYADGIPFYAPAPGVYLTPYVPPSYIVPEVHPQWRAVVREVAHRLNRDGVDYKVVGGASVALHGVPLPVQDVDLETDAAGAYRFQALFADHVVEPVTLREGEQYRSYFGRFDFDGVQVEVMGEIHRREGETWVPTWTQTEDVVNVEGEAVRTSWLEEETLAYIRRGRLERAAMCLPFCDRDRLLTLLRRERVRVL